MTNKNVSKDHSSYSVKNRRQVWKKLRSYYDGSDRGKWWLGLEEWWSWRKMVGFWIKVEVSIDRICWWIEYGERKGSRLSKVRVAFSQLGKIGKGAGLGEMIKSSVLDMLSLETHMRYPRGVGE